MGVAVTLAMRKGGGEFVFVDLTNRSNGKDNNDDGVCHAPDTKRWNAHRADPFWYSVFLFVVKAVASVAPPRSAAAQNKSHRGVAPGQRTRGFFDFLFDNHTATVVVRGGGGGR